MKKSEPVKENAPKMVPVEKANEQVQAVVRQANAKIQQMAEKIASLEEMMRDKTVDYLFKIIENATFFKPSFVDKCTAMLELYITKTALEDPTAQEPTPAEHKEEATPETESKKEE